MEAKRKYMLRILAYLDQQIADIEGYLTQPGSGHVICENQGKLACLYELRLKVEADVNHRQPID